MFQKCHPDDRKFLSEGKCPKVGTFQRSLVSTTSLGWTILDKLLAPLSDSINAMKFHDATAILLAIIVTATNFSITRGQMGYYSNDLYNAQTAYNCQNGVYGSAHDCGYGTRNQNWFGSYYLGKANPYGFVSTMPYGYGSGAQPFFSDPYSGGWPGTSYSPSGYFGSALPFNNNNFYPNPNVRY